MHIDRSTHVLAVLGTSIIVACGAEPSPPTAPSSPSQPPPAERTAERTGPPPSTATEPDPAGSENGSEGPEAERSAQASPIALDSEGENARAEPLTSEQIDAARRVARSRLPRVDRSAARECQAMPTQTTDERMASAKCFRQAGSLGVAILWWERIADDRSGPTAAREAVRELGAAFEAAGRYHDAAKYLELYARRFPKDHHTQKLLVRSICMWRQLNDAQAAERAYLYLRGLFGNRVPDAEPLCDALRPIVPPQQ